MKMQSLFRRLRLVQWFFLASVLAFAAFISAHAASGTKDRVYIGTYTEHGSQGIYVCEFDPSNGTLTVRRNSRARLRNPSFLAVSADRPLSIRHQRN